MKVLSLFDGISCGYIALERAGIPIEKYYASEIDEIPIKIAKARHPDIEEIGDVCNVKGEDYKDVDIIIGGSPCTNLSGLGNGKGLEGEQSKLFYEFVRLVKEIKPKYFLLENVKMKKERMDKMSEGLFGVEPILINSSLLSAQNRPRLYRCGKLNEQGGYDKIDIPLPEDKGLTIGSILEEEVDDKYYLTQEQVEKIKNWKSYQNPLDRVLTGESKCPTLTARGAGEWHSGMILITNKGKEIELPCATQLGNSKSRGNAYGTNKAYCLRTQQPNGVILGDRAVRKLTPLECERLQTVPEGYTYIDGIKDSQRYKVLGNGWTIDAIAHILKHMLNNNG